MDKLIDSALIETHGYSEQEVKAFYDTFLQDLEKYKAQNADSDAFEILYGMLDFDKFKTQMLDQKLGAMTEKSKDDGSKYNAEKS